MIEAPSDTAVSESDINFHRDIKDIDDVDENYDVALYEEVKGMFDVLHKENPAQSHIFKGKIKALVGDYEVTRGLSDEAYKQLKRAALSFDNALN